jgi:hypothetical protein
LSAAAYENLDEDEDGVPADWRSRTPGLGVATRVPSGVCASTLVPSTQAVSIIRQIGLRVD